MKIKSYAKINLYLEVLKKRKDNYHQIITLFERISLFDEIYLKPRPDKRIRIICGHPDIPKGKANLAYRAASLLRKESGISRGVDIKINKRIPAASGLGGGSSNAASVLLGLNRLWNLNLSKKRLIFYGKVLGCDVPFFLSHTSFAIGEDRGDKIRPLGTLKKRLWHILVVPKIKVSTKMVYKQLDKIFLGSKVRELTKPISDVKMLAQMLKEGNLALIRKALFNRLEMVSLVLYPEVNRLKNIMLDLRIEAISMSGSGPAMFGIVSSRKEAGVLCRKLSNVGSYNIFIAKTA